MLEKVFHILILSSTGFMFGCSGVIYKEYSIDTIPAKSISIDARQRVVLVTDKGGKLGNRHIVCAEPGPDVMASVAASAAANLGTGDKSLEVAGQMVESAAAIGQRTQTIQLLRDGLYRACEAYMNGIIDWREYKQIVSGMDEAMITLVAIDGLTQRAPVQQIVIGGKASTQTGNGDQNGTTERGKEVMVPSSITSNLSSESAKAVKELVNDYYNYKIELIKLQKESNATK